MANMKYISSFIIFGQTRAIKRAVPSDLLAKKKQLSFHEGLRPIAASIKEGLLLVFKVDHCVIWRPQIGFCQAPQYNICPKLNLIYLHMYTYYKTFDLA